MESSRRIFFKKSLTSLAALSTGAMCASPTLVQNNNEAKYVNVQGIKTRYFEAGSGENLLLIHGGNYGHSFYSANSWNLNIEVLSRNFHVYALDKLGMGYTDNPPTDAAYTMAATVEHVYGFMKALGIEKASIAGHSRGALPGAHIAVEHPEMVKSLIVFDSRSLAPTDPSIGAKENPFYTNLLANPPAIPDTDYLRREPDANSYFQHHITDEYASTILEIEQLSKTAIVQEKMGHLKPQFVADASKVKEKTLSLITEGKLLSPTLVIWGYNDPSSPLDLGLDLMKVITPVVPNSQLLILNQAGHYVFRDQADKVNRIVKEFINSL